jgi:hypothetical protein
MHCLADSHDEHFAIGGFSHKETLKRQSLAASLSAERLQIPLRIKACQKTGPRFASGTFPRPFMNGSQAIRTYAFGFA